METTKRRWREQKRKNEWLITIWSWMSSSTWSFAWRIGQLEVITHFGLSLSYVRSLWPFVDKRQKYIAIDLWRVAATGRIGYLNWDLSVWNIKESQCATIHWLPCNRRNEPDQKNLLTRIIVANASSRGCLQDHCDEWMQLEHQKCDMNDYSWVIDKAQSTTFYPRSLNAVRIFSRVNPWVNYKTDSWRLIFQHDLLQSYSIVKM